MHAFCEGLTDAHVKKVVEEKLDTEGWAWRVLRGIVTGLVREMELHKRAGTEEVTRKRKRRVIPVVWPVEGADGWDF
jgi:hypothetical protein